MTSDSTSKARRCRRRPVILALTLILDPEGKRAECPASTFDLSPYGAGVDASIPLLPGQVVEVLPREGAEYSLRGRVIWAGEVKSEGSGKAGLEFLLPQQSTA